ncbi:MAG: glycosyltransferase [Algoriphagus sp.]|nr:glycosyltransferase [Algoriphagus sp.]
MHFLVVGHVSHKLQDGKYFAYGPYVREMNIWFKHVDKVTVLAPFNPKESPDPIDLPYQHGNLSLISVPGFSILSFSKILMTLAKFPVLWIRTWKAMRAADHIHLRCPGNMGLLGALVQMFFPNKIKSAKYAGNWDRLSGQPLSYRIQQNILSNPRLSKRMQILVYGDWENESENVRPFFTASYSAKEITPLEPRLIGKGDEIRLIFAGGLNAGKQPMISAKVCKELIRKGINARLDLFGEGPERIALEKFIGKNRLEKSIILHGNVPSDRIKTAFQQAHFLIFISQSEGWPKVVAEAMFWGCLPVTTAVSCVPQMLGNGERGELVGADVAEITGKIEFFIQNPKIYQTKTDKAASWSREFTLEKFEKEIHSVLFDR